jgi:hypothetical protein
MRGGVILVKQRMEIKVAQAPDLPLFGALVAAKGRTIVKIYNAKPCTPWRDIWDLEVL